MRIHASHPRRSWLLLAVLLPCLCLAGCAARGSRGPVTDRAVAASPTPVPTFTPVPHPLADLHAHPVAYPNAHTHVVAHADTDIDTHPDGIRSV